MRTIYKKSSILQGMHPHFFKWYLCSKNSKSKQIRNDFFILPKQLRNANVDSISEALNSVVLQLLTKVTSVRHDARKAAVLVNGRESPSQFEAQ